MFKLFGVFTGVVVVIGASVECFAKIAQSLIPLAIRGALSIASSFTGDPTTVVSNTKNIKFRKQNIFKIIFEELV